MVYLNPERERLIKQHNDNMFYSLNYVFCTAYLRLSQICYSYGGSVEDNFIMDDVACTGSETNILSCPYNPSDNCGTSEGAGVVCTV